MKIPKICIFSQWKPYFISLANALKALAISVDQIELSETSLNFNLTTDTKNANNIQRQTKKHPRETLNSNHSQSHLSTFKQLVSF